MARQHHKYKMKRIIIHFVRPIIENLVFISGFQRVIYIDLLDIEILERIVS